MTPTELRELADRCDEQNAANDPIEENTVIGDCGKTLRAIAERDEKMRGLVERWRKSSAGHFGERDIAVEMCADELAALLGR